MNPRATQDHGNTMVYEYDFKGLNLSKDPYEEVVRIIKDAEQKSTLTSIIILRNNSNQIERIDKVPGFILEFEAIKK